MPTALVVVGTRPEAIKLAPVIRAMSGVGRIDPLVVSTAQHGESVDRMLATFGVSPDFDLDVLRPGDGLTAVTTRTLARTVALISDVAPDAVVVQGDTTAAFAGALAAFQCRVPVVHVEAGLRTGDRSAPYPEEMNRRLVSQLADVHCAPTARARDNLVREGVDTTRIHVTGNTVVDALEVLAGSHPAIESPAGLGPGVRPVVVTIHRRETWGAPLEGIAMAVASLARSHPQVEWVVPVHPNPVVRETLRSILDGSPNVRLVPAMDYLTFIELMRRARLVLTDSGGIQEEAPSLGVQVLVLRDLTERPEVLDTGLVRLVGTAPDRITAAVDSLLRADGLPVYEGTNPVGDGRAAERVEMAVAHRLGVGDAPKDFEPTRATVPSSR